MTKLHRCRNDKKLPHSAAVGHQMFQTRFIREKRCYNEQNTMFVILSGAKKLVSSDKIHCETFLAIKAWEIEIVRLAPQTDM
jgi:hypothetical protein